MALQPLADDALRSLGDVGHRAADLGGVGQPKARGPGAGEGASPLGIAASFPSDPPQATQAARAWSRSDRCGSAEAARNLVVRVVRAGVHELDGTRDHLGIPSGTVAATVRRMPACLAAVLLCRWAAASRLLAVLVVDQPDQLVARPGGRRDRAAAAAATGCEPAATRTSPACRRRRRSRTARRLQNIADALVADRANAQRMAAAAPLGDPSSPECVT